MDKKIKKIIAQVKRPAEKAVKRVVKKEIKKDEKREKKAIKREIKKDIKKALKPIKREINEIQKESHQAGYGLMKLHSHHGTKNEAIKVGIELRNKGHKVRVLARRGRHAVYYQ